MITAVGFTTRGRPELLARCAESFVAQCLTHGRRPRLIVMDDAVPGRHASARPVAERLARDHPDFAVFYAGSSEKRAFADALAATGQPLDAVEFALLDPEDCGYTLGANRNGLQLEALGEQVLYVDDDCLAATARPPDWDERLAVVGPGSTQEYWYYPDHGAAMAAARFDDVDLLGQHEAYLGRHCGAIMATADSDGAAPDAFADYMRTSAVVKVTQNGVVGDSCMFSNLWNLLHDGPATRGRLAASPDVLETAMTSREIIRSPSRPTLRLGGMLIGPVYGCDQASLLPPYFPVFRGSDTSFSCLLSHVYPAYAFADVPWIVEHAPPSARDYSARGYRQPWRCSVVDAVCGLVRARAHGAYHSLVNPLAPVGEHLADLGSLPGPAFAEELERVADEAIAHKAERAEWLLAESTAMPGHYTGALERSLRTLRRSARDPLRGAPVELEPRAVRSLQRLVGRFGAVLAAWKGIDEAARDLRERGIGLAARV